ncbi:CRISPR-associated protein Csx16 [Neisseria sp. HSC-16F19]|nr:CRISPR-associated protein Csx16 [Neisseria sp. HSC-16F19]MCP2041860.1 CRISPR-associated protein Csx16 [Neisseria sp. HSC-16F19]
MVYFVSRHPGAIAWIKQQKEWQVDRFISHLDPQEIAAGDIVLGTLPLHLAAEVCKRGAVFYFLTVPQQEAGRGTEYTLEDMQAMACSLRRFEVLEY